MNTGKIMIGLVLVLLSAAMVVSPSNAAGPDTSCSPGCGCVVFSGSNGMVHGGDGLEGLIGETTPVFTAATDPVSAP